MRPSFMRAILGGLLATIVITFLMYWVAPLLLGGPMDIARLLGGFLGTTRGVGMSAHYFNGAILFPLIFVGIWNLLPGGPTAKGISWGIALWFMAQAVVMPIVGAGFFSANAGGFLAAFFSLLGHIVYGAILGAVTGGAESKAIEERRAA